MATVKLTRKTKHAVKLQGTRPPPLSIGEAFLFPDQDAVHNAFPKSIQYADGAIDVFYRAGSAHTGTDGVVKKYRSTDKGREWTGPTFVASDATFDLRPDCGVCVAPNGDVLLFPGRHNGTTAVDFGVLRSTDGGENWNALEVKVPSDYGFTAFLFPYGRPLVRGGNIYFAAYGQDSSGYTKTRVALMKSADNGATITKVGEIVATAIGWGSAINLNECAFYTEDETNWIAFYRIDNSPIGMSTSSDGGVTWTTGTYFCRGVSPMIVELAGGDSILFVANRAGYPKRINCYRTSDGFKSASKRTAFVDVAAGDDFGYPAPLEVDANLLVPYYLDPTTGGSAQTNLYYARRATSFTAPGDYTADYEHNNEEIDTDYATEIANVSTTKPAAGKTYSIRINDTTAEIWGLHSILNGGTSGGHYFGFNATTQNVVFSLLDNRDRFRFHIFGTDDAGTRRFRWYNGTAYQQFTPDATYALNTDYEIGIVWSGTAFSLWIDGVEHTGGGIWVGGGANAEIMKLGYRSSSGAGTGDDYHVQYEASGPGMV